MSTLTVPHLDPDTLEAYALGRLEEPTLAGAEEHLLLCALCQDRLENLDEFIEAFRLVQASREEENKPRLLARRAAAG